MVFGLFRSDPPVAIPNRSLWKNLFDAEYESTSEKTRPKITLFLNATNIGTVDGADQSTLSVRTRRGHRSWKLRYFKYLFVVSAHNCWEVVSASPRQQHHLQGPSVFLLIWGLMAKTEEGVSYCDCRVYYKASNKKKCVYCNKSCTSYKCVSTKRHNYPDCLTMCHNWPMFPRYSHLAA